METLIEDLKKVMNSDIEEKDKYMGMLINGFLIEKQTEWLKALEDLKEFATQHCPTEKADPLTAIIKRI